MADKEGAPVEDDTPRTEVRSYAFFGGGVALELSKLGVQMAPPPRDLDAELAASQAAEAASMPESPVDL